MTLTELLIVFVVMAVPAFVILGWVMLIQPSQTPEPHAPAGWYADPDRPTGWRWWDGSQWTELTDDNRAALDGVES